jgi:acyl-[acyl-carrier-protein]-phospholipid O-acyltransferase/long-chain-fatty-acid--[acyl-carrier-protein] ligase
MIWFKGPNVFEGYLNDPKRSADVLKDGWFRTGDIGRVDLDGFLYIEGRLSRFSKIAGEMVPHETVEESLVKAMGLENETVRKIAVVGVPDPTRARLSSSSPACPAALSTRKFSTCATACSTKACRRSGFRKR